jgi:hypothetical protein
MKLALKVTPQRSTQYTNMVQALAIPELLASPLHHAITDVALTRLAGHLYLLADIDEERLSSAEQFHVLYRLGTISETYEYFERVGEVEGPLLRPIEPQFQPFVPWEMVETRRYKGKTNELFTQVLLNVAVFASAYSEHYAQPLRILDPLAGGGTTLFVGLALGYHVFGIELTRQDVETTALFSKQFLNSEHVPYKEIDERGRRAGRRYLFAVGPRKLARTMVLVHGDAREALSHMREVPGGPHMHAIVGDLPYGIQHFGEIAGLLRQALPVWEQMLLPGGAVALAWNATRIERSAIVELFQQHTGLQVRNDPPYTQFAHTVDRVIKRRDIIVAVRSA